MHLEIIQATSSSGKKCRDNGLRDTDDTPLDFWCYWIATGIPVFDDCFKKADCNVMEILQCAQDRGGEWEGEWEDEDNECVKEAQTNEDKIETCLKNAEVFIQSDCSNSKIQIGLDLPVTIYWGFMCIMNLLMS